MFSDENLGLINKVLDDVRQAMGGKDTVKQFSVSFISELIRTGDLEGSLMTNMLCPSDDLVPFYMMISGMDSESGVQRCNNGTVKMSDVLKLVHDLYFCYCISMFPASEAAKEEYLKSMNYKNGIVFFKSIVDEDYAISQIKGEVDLESKIMDITKFYLRRKGLYKEEDKKDSELYERATSYYRTFITTSVDKLENIYRQLFSSGYQVVKPFGILTPNGILQLHTEESTLVDDPAIVGMYRNIARYINIEICQGRCFDINRIVNNSGKIFYFPEKMLEIAYGRRLTTDINNSDNKPYYYSSHRSSWDNYYKNELKPYLINLFKTILVKILERDDCYSLSFFNDSSPDAKDLEFQRVRETINKLLDSLSFCIVVSDWQFVSDKPVSMKLRITDLGTFPARTGDFLRPFIDSYLNGMTGSIGYDAMPDAMVKNGVIEYSHCFDALLSSAEPLFAFKALDSLKANAVGSGRVLSFDNIILGIDESDNILTSADPRVRMGNNLCHFITAGSRSGKGVMTFNIMASAIASRKPIFYLDNKPDMSCMMRLLSNDNCFVLNGQIRDTMADTRGLFSDESLRASNWNKNIPDYLLKLMGTPVTDKSQSAYSKFGPMFYLRAVMFIMTIFNLKLRTINNPEVYNNLGGDEGIFVVFDEYTIFNATENCVSLFCEGEGLGGQCRGTQIDVKYDKSNRAEESGKTVSEADKIKPINMYANRYLRDFTKSFTAISGMTVAGIKNKETRISDIFILGQSMDYKSGMPKLIKESAGTSMNGCSCFMDFLLALPSDAMFGYNSDKSNYMGAGIRGSKASVKLTETARNFCYLPEFNQSVLQTVKTADVSFSNNAMYFKPFLILNEVDKTQSNYGPFMSQLLKNLNSWGLNIDEVKARNCGADGDWRDEIGFLSYLSSAGVSKDELVETLGKSSKIANYILKCIGYPGDWREFIWDLRPEWMFNVDELTAAVLGNISMSDFRNRFGIFYEAFPEEFSGGGNLDVGETVDYDNEVHGDADNPIPVNGLRGYTGGASEGTEEPEDYEEPLEEPDDLEEPLDEPDEDLDDLSYLDKLVESDDDDLFEDDSEDNSTQEEQSSVAPEQQKEPHTQDESEVVKSLKQIILEQNKQIQELKQMLMSSMNSEDMSKRVDHNREKYKSKEIPEDFQSSSDTVNFNGTDIHYKPYTRGMNLGLSLDDFDSEDLSSVNMRNLRSVSHLIMKEFEMLFGSLDRITEFIVMDEMLIVNGVGFTPKLSQEDIDFLPYDIQDSVADGRLAMLFDFDNLKYLKNLTKLGFNDPSFVYDKVRNDMCTKQKRGFSQRDFFELIPSLGYCQIGDEVMTEADFMNNKTGRDFENQKRRYEIYDKISSKACAWTRGGARGLRDTWLDPTRKLWWKAASTPFYAAKSVVGATGFVGSKVGKEVSKYNAKKNPNRVRKRDTIKQSFKDVFSSFRDDDSYVE